MMATPADLEDFAVGFTLSEAIVASVADIADARVERYSQGIEMQLTIPTAAAAALAQRAPARGAHRLRAVWCRDHRRRPASHAVRSPRRGRSRQRRSGRRRLHW